jgi:dTDP-4-amino-4,6-dideoxygalactose transaminase
VIYDAAHAFGVRHQGNSILQHGDMSILSFHATKVFNTFEGGAIICQDERSKQRIDYLKNFGFANETTVIATGINGKMSEFNAALGLLQLKHIDRAIARRRQIDLYYRQQLKSIPGLVPMTPESDHLNQSYFPIMVSPEFPLSRDQLYEHLKRHQIHGRRYFYPLISDFPMYRSLPSAKSSNLPAARSLADRVICLPIYPDLSDDQVKEIVHVLADSLENFNFHSKSSESINEVTQTKNLSDALEDLSDLETVSSMFTPLLGRAPRDLLPNQMAGFGV